MDISATWTVTDKDLQKFALSLELGQTIYFRTYCNKEMQGEIKDEKDTISVIRKNNFVRCNK